MEALLSKDSPLAFRQVIFEGTGDALALLDVLAAKRSSGQSWFPLLGGPKVSVMWIRMLADPGEADIENIDKLTVAVDVQVRKVTEYLGVANTAGRPLDVIRGEIQQAWARVADAASGTQRLARTSAALDPALWFFGKWGCTYCEQRGHQLPISTVCNFCSFRR
jgi:hypothetical protein